MEAATITATATAIATLFSAVNSWEVGTVLLFIFFVPPFLGLLAIWRISTAVGALKAQIINQQTENSRRFEKIVALSEKHFSAFEERYANNIYLVKNYEKLAGDLSTIVHLNTQAITRLVDRIDFSKLKPEVSPKRGE